MKQPLTAHHIAELDEGRVGIAIGHALKQITHDLVDRPQEKGPRRLKIELEVRPVLDSDGTLHSANIVAQIESKFPKKKTRALNVGVHHSGALIHNAASPTDIRQGTLDDANADE